MFSKIKKAFNVFSEKLFSRSKLSTPIKTDNPIYEGLNRTRNQIFSGLARFWEGQKKIDGELLAELENRLLLADVGPSVTKQVLDSVSKNIERANINDLSSLLELIRIELINVLSCSVDSLDMSSKLTTILVIGVNGVGKTTTIGKLAHYFVHKDKKVMLAAGDTFRAAAIEQLCVWASKVGVPIVHQQTGADSAACIFDALQSATAKGYDILLADTAGRLHSKDNLLEELKKVKKVLSKIDSTSPQEVWLVLDATIGQNALAQARKFNESLGLTGLIVTKMDGTAKGGIVFAIADELKIPIRFIGIGEGIEDLKPFDAKAFVDALIDQSRIL